MTYPAISRIDGPESFRTQFGISRETLARFETYAALLTRWQKTINLVAPSTVGDVWHRHFADSAQLMRYAPNGATRWLDLGSGAGFPGLVLAILAAERGGQRHTLIESDTRKAAFLREVARETGVAVEIVTARIELAETAAKVGEINCVTARALAPLPRLATWVAPYFGSSTVGLFLKGRDVAAELDEARREWDFDFQLLPSVTDEAARVVRMSGLRAKL
ncbi:MAG TPA: 16S rRNA (guanine(527)-N(7))-methyltransferase RsmG [Hyphomicrobium sp.]|nr:16S rRNA (guanine(527)-N(7))-methyltransferase RsmG [Hyphomicrobium sp.]